MRLYDTDITRIAIIDGQRQYTYDEFCKNVTALSAYFASKRIRRIAFLMDKGYVAYLALWAAYMSGATVCSLDVSLPPKRVDECLTLFCPDMVITDFSMESFRCVSPQELLSICQSAAELHSVARPDAGSPCDSNSVLYVLFTSGSTGKPKGVAILRKAFEEVIAWAVDHLGMKPDDKIGNYCSLGFDMGLCDVFLALTVGAQLVAIPEKAKLYPGRMVRRHNITWLYAVPTILDFFEAQKDFEKGNLASLRQVGFGGASLYERHMRFICRHRPDLTVFNTYGPTETTLFTSCVVYQATEYVNITEESVCLGQPVTGVRYALIDHDAHAKEMVVVGEHCLAGYLQQDHAIDFAAACSMGSYETGDLVYMKNGEYYFIARKDNQVKVRGNRVDLDGIASFLRTADVSAVALVVDEKLILFHSGDASASDVRRKLEDYLPRNSLPDAYVHVGEIPLNINGKYDKAILLDMYKNSV